MLLNIEQMLSYLPDQQRQDIMLLIKEYPSLFADTPSQTTAIVHDMKLRDQLPYVNIPIV